MHVCHICDSSIEGDYFRNIAAGLTEKGVRVSLIELGAGNAPTWLKNIPGLTYLSLNAANKLHYPAAVRRLSRFLLNERVDILHTHLFYSGLIGVLAKRFGGRSQVALMRHHTSVVRMLGSQLHVAADKWMAEKADHVLTVSEAARRYMVETDGIRRDSIDVVYLGFDFEKLAPNAAERRRIRQEFNFTDDDFVIGYVANLASGKGHIQLIEAFRKISIEIPNAKLLFAGRGMLADVQVAAETFAPGQVTFAGWRSDVAAILNAMDLFVQPSLSEAFSQVLIEAMGVGLPVIATNVGGAGEVIESGINGVLIAPDDSGQIAREVVRLYSDGPLQNSIAKAGTAMVTERFTAEQMVDRQFDLYKNWLGIN